MNPLTMLNIMKNPKQFVMNSLGENIDNPMMSNLVKMAQKRRF